MKRIGFLFPLLALVGCGLMPPPVLTDELAARLPGRPHTFEAMTAVALEEILVDPGSAELRLWTEPEPGYRFVDPFWPTIEVVGWYWSVQVNAKNRLGGYTGWQLYEFLWTENRRLLWDARTSIPTLRFFERDARSRPERPEVVQR